MFLDLFFFSIGALVFTHLSGVSDLRFLTLISCFSHCRKSAVKSAMQIQISPNLSGPILPNREDNLLQPHSRLWGVGFFTKVLWCSAPYDCAYWPLITIPHTPAGITLNFCEENQYFLAEANCHKAHVQIQQFRLILVTIRDNHKTDAHIRHLSSITIIDGSTQ